MKEGLLWYDASDKTLAAKIAEAAQAYQRKFGRRPDTCHVAPETAGDKAVATKAGPIRLVGAATVRPHHFWIGCEETHP